MKKIAVCLPTFNEEDMIELTARKVDKALIRYREEYDTYIVNCDSNSTDKTCDLFKQISTNSKSICITSSKKGKGINILNFLQFCKIKKIDYAIMLDVDVISMSEKWINTFLKELIENNMNYVVPSYQRNRFEGSTTNHFVFPLVYALTGKCIRQPIGGDFAFDKKYISYICDKSINASIEQYGIDIFLTLNAIYGNFNIQTVYLEQKIHKPSFSKMYGMFRQVFEAAVFTVQSQPVIIFPGKGEKIDIAINILEDSAYSHKKEAIALADNSFENLNGKLTMFGTISKKQICDEQWICIFIRLLSLLKEKHQFTEDEISDFVDIFILRAVTYWDEVEYKKSIEAERIVVQVAEKLRDDTTSF